ncbi:hypothetical protein SDC9_52489 [bioreactor metagenome]|uniref:Uncharacterized protein n=1 Tax=bioreactor metagenome TaxID=1076179 RepID=A0A644WVU6_9ZZZZ
MVELRNLDCVQVFHVGRRRNHEGPVDGLPSRIMRDFPDPLLVAEHGPQVQPGISGFSRDGHGEGVDGDSAFSDDAVPRFGPLGVVADDAARLVRGLRHFQVRMPGEIVTGYGPADDIGRDKQFSCFGVA